MAKLFGNNPDGAGAQARAVLAYLSDYSGIEESWNGMRCTDEPSIARWHNGREQGYVVSLTCAKRQLNIAFFEHRNSDDICAVKWEQTTLNPPTIDTLPQDVPYSESKWNVSHTVPHGAAEQMAKWIFDELCGFSKEQRDKQTEMLP